MQYWLVKHEPESYSWSDFLKDGRTAWTGVRNFTARNNLRSMQTGDHVFYYHSVTDKQIVGIAKVIKEAYKDPTAEEGDWVCVDLAPVKQLENRVSLAEIKSDKALAGIALAKYGRLSVQPVTKQQFERILKMSNTNPP